MKLILTIAYLLFASLCFGQTTEDSVVVYNLTTPYRPATIQLIKDTVLIQQRYVFGNIKMAFKQIEAGDYKILVVGITQKTVLPESIHVKGGQQLVLNVKLDGPCLYDHPAKYTPCCPYNHTDSIVPIAYGLTLQVLDEEKVHSGGCVMTGCDPHFYCKIHKTYF